MVLVGNISKKLNFGARVSVNMVRKKGVLGGPRVGMDMYARDLAPSEDLAI